MKESFKKSRREKFTAERVFYNLNIAFEAVFANRFRSILTALGIIFGVAAVIAMLAIGSGARQEILDQMKLIGVNNIIVRPILSSDSEMKDEYKGKFSPGLTINDAESIKSIIPTVAKVSPEIEISTFAVRDGIRKQIRVAGVTPDYFDLFNLRFIAGAMFVDDNLKNGDPVCIIGNSVKIAFFGNTNPIGKQIKCGNNWLTVVGVIEDRLIKEDNMESLGVGQFTNTVYAPVKTILLRFNDRSFVSATDISRAKESTWARSFISNNNGEQQSQVVNYHQLDRIIVQVDESENLASTASVIKRMLKRKHNGVEDFEVIIPEVLLKQEQRTKDIFNIVLGAIAGISLIVGGIGIMNIMLASVMERTREIGVRLAIGAKKSDVVLQFLAESTFISLTGGIIGVFLGILLSKLIMKFAGILTIVSPESILISFGVAAIIGIGFGFMPARKAAEKDPVNSLRYE
ncbi:MAG: ABC transporter permease [Bacteroidetes bacterium]|nr:ABC transporter permease [Bacteroidota bacterium]